MKYNFLESIILANNTYIWLFIPVTIMIALFWYRGIKTNRIIKIIAPYNKNIKLLLHFSHVKMVAKIILLSIGSLSLCIALLRLQWGTKDEKIIQQGRDVFIALDISRSMLAENRLDSAKGKIKKLTTILKPERVGLVLFSGSAIIQCPLTTDLSAFNLFLDTVDVETISSGTTAMEKAITVVLDVYRTMPTKKNKLLILFTDGEDFSSHLPSVQAQAHEEGLSIFACGMGSVHGAPIPLFNEAGKIVGHQKDKQGNIVISKLHEAELQNLVKQVGGKYVRMTENDTDMNTIAQEVSFFEKEQFDHIEHSTHIDRYGIFIAISFFCFLLEWVL
jgi:Ca-activated chloride channel family protein